MYSYILYFLDTYLGAQDKLGSAIGGEVVVSTDLERRGRGGRNKFKKKTEMLRLLNLLLLPHQAEKKLSSNSDLQNEEMNTSTSNEDKDSCSHVDENRKKGINRNVESSPSAATSKSSKKKSAEEF